MTAAKNHVRLVAIVAALARRLPAARLILVGRGGNEIESAVRRAVAAAGLQDRVHLLGERDDVARLLAAADVMLFPSQWEGLPGAVLEAAAAGLPVLASDLPCVGEIAARLPLVHCLPLEASDEVWAQTLRERLFAADRPSRETARRQFAETPFSIEQCVDQLAQIWTEAANAHGCYAEAAHA
jgi:glycosyltransferase involved in cell wall biosynthesis